MHTSELMTVFRDKEGLFNRMRSQKIEELLNEGERITFEKTCQN